MSFGLAGVDVTIDGVDVLRGVDVLVPSGDVVAVVGGDGAGKSTLLRCLVGRVAPRSGTVDRPERASIGYMPSTSGTWRQLTVAENIEFVGASFGMSPVRLAERRAELLDRADLTDVTNRLAGDLSGGMRQKLGFVLAVLHSPTLLVLDEPSTGVDPVSRVELWRLITEAAVLGTAVAITTAYLDEAERATTVYVLDGGRVIAAGGREELTASVPGSIATVRAASVPERSWRRGRAIRQWYPDGETLDDAAVRLDDDGLDFEDAVIARMLADRMTREAEHDRRRRGST